MFKASVPENSDTRLQVLSLNPGHHPEDFSGAAIGGSLKYLILHQNPSDAFTVDTEGKERQTSKFNF